MSGHPALSPCSTGGTCSVSERVPAVVRGMREKDGRCTGCGRAVTRPDPSEVRRAFTTCGKCREPIERSAGGVWLSVKSGSWCVEETSHEPAVLEPAEPAAAALVSCGRQGGKTTRVEAEAENVLRATSTEGLVDAVIQLTHQIHGCLDGKHDARAADLRAQRALVKAEIVRRAS